MGVRISEVFGLNRSSCKTKKRFQLSEMFVTKRDVGIRRYKTYLPTEVGSSLTNLVWSGSNSSLTRLSVRAVRRTGNGS